MGAKKIYHERLYYIEDTDKYNLDSIFYSMLNIGHKRGLKNIGDKIPRFEIPEVYGALFCGSRHYKHEGKT